MSTFSVFTRGAVSGNGWTSPGNATADDGVYATANPGKNITITGQWDYAAIAAADIPDGSTINSVTAEVQWKASQGSFNTLTLTNFSGATQDSTVAVNPAPLTDTVKQLAYTTVPSLTDLRTAGRVITLVSHKKGNTTNAYTGSVDYIKLIVDYTVGSTVVTGAVAVAAGATAAATGSRTIRSAIAASPVATVAVNASNIIRSAVSAAASAVVAVAGGAGGVITGAASVAATATVAVAASVRRRGATVVAAAATNVVTASVIRGATVVATGAANVAIAASRVVRSSVSVTGTATLSIIPPADGSQPEVPCDTRSRSVTIGSPGKGSMRLG